MSDTLRTLERFARARVAAPAGAGLERFLERTLDVRRVTSGLMVPEELSLGYATPSWPRLGDEQRLALNHWAWFMTYFRIGAGERFAVRANAAVARFLDRPAPHVAALLRLENAEEEDHLRAFGRMGEVVARRWGFDRVSMPEKPMRAVGLSPRVLGWLTERLGVDFVVTYFLGRGIVNHLGKGFELAVARTSEGAACVRELSRLHTLDENRHMAVSRMMAECARELVDRRRRRNGLYACLHRHVRRLLVWHTFSDRTTGRQERAMSRKALHAIPALQPLARRGIDALIDQHFAVTTGIDAARNAYMPPFNERLLAHADISSEDRREWREQIAACQGRSRFFPSAPAGA